MTAMIPGRAPALAFAVVASSALAAQGQTLALPSDAPEAQACLRELASYQQEAQELAKATVAASKNRTSREELCKLVAACSTAEAKWLNYAEDNRVSCGMSTQAVEQIRSAHMSTLHSVKKLCGPSTRVKPMRIAGRPQS
jgi:hypothetical protein